MIPNYRKYAALKPITAIAIFNMSFKAQEKMEYIHIGESKVVEADKEKDLMFLEAAGETFLVKEGYFAVFTPEDAHRPGMCANTTRAD